MKKLTHACALICILLSSQVLAKKHSLTIGTGQTTTPEYNVKPHPSLKKYIDSKVLFSVKSNRDNLVMRSYINCKSKHKKLSKLRSYLFVTTNKNATWHGKLLTSWKGKKSASVMTSFHPLTSSSNSSMSKEIRRMGVALCKLVNPKGRSPKKSVRSSLLRIRHKFSVVCGTKKIGKKKKVPGSVDMRISVLYHCLGL